MSGANPLMNKIDNNNAFCPKGELANRMIEVNNKIVQALNQRMKNEIGISLAKYEVLRAIQKSTNDYITMTDLSRNLLVSNANMTGMSTRLQADGFVVKKALPRDRRIYCVALTETGHEILEKSNEKLETWVNEIMSLIDGGETALMHNLLDKMDKKIEVFSQAR